jgi:geranylgeranylglycerol-phosphate geranylgeranyltransferase
MKCDSAAASLPARAWGPPGVATVATGLRLMRVEKPLCAAALTLLGAWLAGPASALLSARVLTGAACVFFITAFGFVINDCCDVRVDAIGKPARPLPSRRASLRGAQAYAWTLAAIGLAIGLVLGGTPSLFAVGALALSALYSYRLKRTVLWGNASVALLVAAVLIFGAELAGGPTPAAWAAAAMTFSFIVAQEALFTLDDEIEDRAAGLATTATVLGTARAARLVRMLLVVFVGVALTPWLTGRASTLHVVALCVVSIAPAAVLFVWLRAPVDRARVARAARLSRWIWVSSFVPLALLK